MAIKTKLRLAFWKYQDFLDCRDQLSASVEIESLDCDTIETNWDHQGYLCSLNLNSKLPIINRRIFLLIIKYNLGGD